MSEVSRRLLHRVGVWLAVFGVAAGLLAPAVPASAAAPSAENRQRSIRSEVDRLRQQVGEASDEEVGIAAELEASRAKRRQLDATVAALDVDIATTVADMATVDAQLRDALVEEQAAAEAVTAAERRLDDARSLLRDQAVKAFMSFGNTPSVDEMVLGLDDVNDAPRVAVYVGAVAELQAGVVDRLQRLQEEATLLRAKAADAKAAVAARRQEVDARRRALESARSQHASAQAAVAAEAANEQQLLAQVQTRKADYLQRIGQLEKESADIAAELRRRQAGQKVTPTGRGVLGYPTPRPVVTSTFGYRVHPIYGDRRLHAGVDFRAPTGTPILAAGAGTVVFAGWKSGYGNTVVIDHGGQIATLYGHNSALSVRVGQRVARGQTIAAAGSTGNSTGPHCHFEVRVGGTPVDPMRYL